MSYRLILRSVHRWALINLIITDENNNNLLKNLFAKKKTLVQGKVEAPVLTKQLGDLISDKKILLRSCGRLG